MADGEKENDVLRQVKKNIDSEKREVALYYAELSLKLPTYIKKLTLKELRDKGAIIKLPSLHIPREAIEELRTGADSHRKNAFVIEKLREDFKHKRNEIESYYRNIINQLPKELRTKNLPDLSEEDWQRVGIDITKFRDKSSYQSRGAPIKRK